MTTQSVCIWGNLGSDPKIIPFSNGAKKASFSVAAREHHKDKDGKTTVHTEWIEVVAYGKLAEIVERYFKKGAGVFINGRLRTEKWEKDGKKHQKMVVLADSAQLTDKFNSGDEKLDAGQQQWAAEYESMQGD